MSNEQYHWLQALLWANLLPHSDHLLMSVLICVPLTVSFYTACWRKP